MSPYWPAIAFSLTIIFGFFRFLYLQWRDRRNIYAVFIEQCASNYLMLMTCLPKDQSSIDTNDIYPAVMALAGPIEFYDSRFSQHHYSDLHKLSRSKIHTIMAIDTMSSQVISCFKLWKDLRRKGTERTEVEVKKTGALAALIFSDTFQLAEHLERALKNDSRGKKAIAASSKFVGKGVKQVRAYREATDQHYI